LSYIPFITIIILDDRLKPMISAMKKNPLYSNQGLIILIYIINLLLFPALFFY